MGLPTLQTTSRNNFGFAFQGGGFVSNRSSFQPYIISRAYKSMEIRNPYPVYRANGGVAPHTGGASSNSVFQRDFAPASLRVHQVDHAQVSSLARP
jgi:hypothetical protein